MSNLKSVLQEKPNFSQDEEEIYAFWNEIDAFKQQLENTKDFPKFQFYDGPPFATGLPHYGNILAGTIKDVVCRYASQTGHFVERRFGWDCHGLPIEHLIDKKLNIQNKQQVLDMGIDKYNDECRKIVMLYSQEWRKIIGRLGRWIDFDNDYKTMDLYYMNSEWWVFNEIFKKGLVYRGCKVMPYSTACTTVLSNFEVAQNYKEVNDPSVYVSMPLVDDSQTHIIIWTTTPWTLPSNLAVCVNPKIVYVKLFHKKNNLNYIIAECLIKDVFKKKEEYQIIEKYTGQELADKQIQYVPLFDYFAKEYKPKGAFRIISDDYVTSSNGTGLVHNAPGFGEDDYRVCLREQMIETDKLPCPIDNDGKFTNEVSDLQGIYFKDADKIVRKILKEKNQLLIDTQVKHNYPFCWRSDTPLIYKAQFVWFIKATAIKENLIDNNFKSEWVPKNIQEGRFNNWLKDVNDWCFSRSRYWGTPIPIWVSDDGLEIQCVSSVEELQQLSGCSEIKDMHREFIDCIEIPSKQGKGMLKRIPEIFDCWFESGSMPFCQFGYPFKISEEEFQKSYPAEFVCEGLDQTRGWFYTLNVISTAIKNESPYKNLIVNGIVQAEDGKKMSKSKQNYPDPMELVNEYGADAIRLYMINSPLVRAQSMNFKKQGVHNVVKDIFLPWYSALRFLLQNIQRFESNNKKFIFDEQKAQEQLSNKMDLWITASCQDLIKFFSEEMKSYKLYTVIPQLLQFIEQLTNWYIKLNRNRLKGDNGDDAMHISLNCLFNVMLKSSILMSPFVPFITESFYQKLKSYISENSQFQNKSIHFLMIPKFDANSMDQQIQSSVKMMEKIIVLGRTIRTQHQISLKQPIQSVSIICQNKEKLDNLQVLIEYIQSELNVQDIIFESNVEQYLNYQGVPNHKELGNLFKKQYNGQVIKQLQNLSQNQLMELKQNKKITINDLEIPIEFCQVKEVYVLKDNKDPLVDIAPESDFSLIMNMNQNEELKIKGTAREITNRIQKLRKENKLNLDDEIEIYISTQSEKIQAAINQEIAYIASTVKKNVFNKKAESENLVADKEYQIDEEKIVIQIKRK